MRWRPACAPDRPPTGMWPAGSPQARADPGPARHAGGRLIALAREAMPAGAIATGDVPALPWLAPVAPRETLTALGMATPGYAVTAAVAAQLAHPDRRVVAFTSQSVSPPRRQRARYDALALAIIVVVLSATADKTTRRRVRARVHRARPDRRGCVLAPRRCRIAAAPRSRRLRRRRSPGRMRIRRSMTPRDGVVIARIRTEGRPTRSVLK